MHIVTVELLIKEQYLGSFLTALSENVVRTRSEPGCEWFDVAASAAESNRIFLYEVYVDQAAFDAHMKTGHFRSFEESTREMVDVKQVRFFRRIQA